MLCLYSILHDLLTSSRLARFLCSFLAGWFGLKLLHTKGTAPRRHSTARRTRQEEEIRSRKMAGRTMDLTLFAATRAADVIVGELWSQRRSRRQAASRWTKVCWHNLTQTTGRNILTPLLSVRVIHRIHGRPISLCQLLCLYHVVLVLLPR